MGLMIECPAILPGESNRLSNAAGNGILSVLKRAASAITLLDGELGLSIG